MKRTGNHTLLVIALAVMACVAILAAVRAGEAYQDAPVMAEAVGQANLRGGPGIDYLPVGEIVAGTRYPVLARHTRVPWLQLEVPGVSEAWVYQDLVTVHGPLSAVPETSAFPPQGTLAPLPAPSATPAAPQAAPAGVPAQPTLTPTLSGPTATTLGEANVRFGPDVTYPVIAEVGAGETFRILERHAIVPWLHIALDDSPTGSGWIFSDVVTVTGDLFSVPATSADAFSYPTLTPTPQTVIVDIAPWQGAPVPEGQLAATLGEELHSYLLEQGFSPYSDRIASVFVMDLTTGDTFTINDNVAFSGMSLTKIPILAAYFQRNPHPATSDEALLLTDTMMCSENTSTNRLLERVGDGDSLVGAQRVTAFLQSLGLDDTFIMRRYVIGPDDDPPSAGTISTGADQVRTQPDTYNQITPSDLGWLLASIYTCAENETGLLVERYPDAFDAQTCRRMLYAMDTNEIGVFLEAGVPADARVIHKHGWIGDTHGDAGIVIGPDGTYVFVATLYGRGWLEFDQSSPVLAELARLTWNALNPQRPLDATRSTIVPAECDPEGDPTVAILQRTNLPMLGP